MKPRRDITLGEMQDECRKYWNNGDFGYCGKCQYMSVCCHYERYCPAHLNLTDPPRFTEAQMAFLRGLCGIGVLRILRGDVCRGIDSNNAVRVLFSRQVLGAADNGNDIDLAELFGKEGEK